jgi:hypothetical protein
MAGSPALYQQMMVAQRQNQLQQQLMLQSPYAPRPMPACEVPGGQQMMMNMHLQQQQHQERMQRQRRLFMGQQQARVGPGAAEEAGETGELDDKLGVLGVLGLQ